MYKGTLHFIRDVCAALLAKGSWLIRNINLWSVQYLQMTRKIIIGDTQTIREEEITLESESDIQ